jgi:hypothetical protein
VFRLCAWDHIQRGCGMGDSHFPVWCMMLGLMHLGCLVPATLEQLHDWSFAAYMPLLDTLPSLTDTDLDALPSEVLRTLA